MWHYIRPLPFVYGIIVPKVIATLNLHLSGKRNQCVVPGMQLRDDRLTKQNGFPSAAYVNQGNSRITTRPAGRVKRFSNIVGRVKSGRVGCVSLYKQQCHARRFYMWINRCVSIGRVPIDSVSPASPRPCIRQTTYTESCGRAREAVYEPRRTVCKNASDEVFDGSYRCPCIIQR